MSLTLGIIKPDAVQSGKAGSILAHLEASGFTVRALQMTGMNAVQAVHAPRVHHQHLPDQIFSEHRGLAESAVGTLRDRGHTVQEREPGPPDAYFTGGMSGDVQLIMVMPDGSLAGWSDPRRGGLAVGYRE